MLKFLYVRNATNRNARRHVPLVGVCKNVSLNQTIKKHSNDWNFWMSTGLDNVSECGQLYEQLRGWCGQTQPFFNLLKILCNWFWP